MGLTAGTTTAHDRLRHDAGGKACDRLLDELRPDRDDRGSLFGPAAVPDLLRDTFLIPIDPNDWRRGYADRRRLCPLQRDDHRVSGYTITARTTVTATRHHGEVHGGLDGPAVLAWGGTSRRGRTGGTKLSGCDQRLAVPHESGRLHLFDCRQLQRRRPGSVPYGRGGDIPGALTIVKDTEPDGSTDFTFTTSGPELSEFALDDDGDGRCPTRNCSHRS